MILTNFSAHREYYINIQKNDKTDQDNNYQIKYLQIISFSIFWGGVITLLLSFFYKASFQTFIASFLFFFVEKLHDEIQRYLLLKKNFSIWGKLNILKSLIFLLSLCLNYYFLRNFENYFLFTILNFVGYVLIIFFYLKIRINYEEFLLFKKNFNIFKIFKNIFDLRVLFLITSISHLALYSERVYISYFNKDILDQITFVAMICSIMPTFLSIFFIQRRVKEFASNEITIKDMFINKFFHMSFFSSILIVWSALLVFHHYQIVNLDYKLIIIIFMIHFIYSLDMTMTELIFWKNNYKIILYNELFYIFGFINIFLFKSYYSLSISSGLLLILFLMTFKMIVYIRLSWNK